MIDLEPEPIDIDEYSSINKYDENKNKKQCVICIMGHVDHGKTTLLDTIQKTNIVNNESGAITQRVSCYHYQLSPRNQITFIDTPGHEIFFKMRSNSVIVADIVILIIDIMEGVKKQTIEVIRKAKQLSIPILLALNKIDKVLLNQMNQTEISGNLSLEEIMSSTQVGKELKSIIQDINLALQDEIKSDDDDDEQSLAFDIIPISAKYGINIDQMLFSLDMLSNAIQLISPRDVNPQAIVLETSSDNYGTYIMLIIHCGILQPNMIIVGGYIYGKIKCIKDPTNNQNIDKGFPGMAVKCYITVFNDISYYNTINKLPENGQVMYVMDIASCKQLLQYRVMSDNLERAIDENKSDMRYLTNDSNDENVVIDQETIFQSIDENELNDKLFDDDKLIEIENRMNCVNELNKGIILRCDSIGCLNVLKQIIQQTHNTKSGEKVKIVECGLGNVTKNDLERQEDINTCNEFDECRIYMFNVDLSNGAIRYYQQLMKKEFNHQIISLKKAKYLAETDETIKRFDVFTDLQNDLYQWLGYEPNIK